MPRQMDPKTSEGPRVIGCEVKHLVSAQRLDLHEELFILKPIGGCLGLAQVGNEERL